LREREQLELILQVVDPHRVRLRTSRVFAGYVPPPADRWRPASVFPRIAHLRERVQPQSQRREDVFHRCLKRCVVEQPLTPRGADRLGISIHTVSVSI
jgi:hypothetical protein